MIAYNTFIIHSPATPLGLLPECWKIMHRCSLCHDQVDPDQLIRHAREHEKEVVAAD